MSYLLTPGQRPIRNRKLGDFVAARRYRPKLLRGLGQEPVNWTYDSQGNITGAVMADGQIIPFVGAATPSTPVIIATDSGVGPGGPYSGGVYAGQGSGAPTPGVFVPQGPSRTYGTVAQDPTMYASPQAAIAAGLDPQTVYSAWVQMFRSKIASGQWRTQQDAIAAGIPAGVVTQLWAQAASSVGSTATSWLNQLTLGVPNQWLLIIGLGIAGLAAFTARRR